MQRAPFAQMDADQSALGLFGGLADRFRNFALLAGAETDAPARIADHHQGGKAEPPAAFHHLGHAVDADQLVDQVAVAATARITAVSASSASWFTCHIGPS